MPYFLFSETQPEPWDSQGASVPCKQGSPQPERDPYRIMGSKPPEFPMPLPLRNHSSSAPSRQNSHSCPWSHFPKAFHQSPHITDSCAFLATGGWEGLTLWWRPSFLSPGVGASLRHLFPLSLSLQAPGGRQLFCSDWEKLRPPAYSQLSSPSWKRVLRPQPSFQVTA